MEVFLALLEIPRKDAWWKHPPTRTSLQQRQVKHPPIKTCLTKMLRICASLYPVKNQTAHFIPSCTRSIPWKGSRRRITLWALLCRKMLYESCAWPGGRLGAPLVSQSCCRGVLRTSPGEHHAGCHLDGSFRNYVKPAVNRQPGYRRGTRRAFSELVTFQTACRSRGSFVWQTITLPPTLLSPNHFPCSQ